MELNRERKVPKTLEGCLEVDPLSESLWNWAENLERFGKILLVILLVCGLIVVIYAGIAAEDAHESVWGAVLSTGFTWIFYAFIEYCAYHALSLLMSALATIVQNTTIAANIAAYNTSIQQGIISVQVQVDSRAAMKDLGELAKQKAKGIISEEEFEKRREELLKQI